MDLGTFYDSLLCMPRDYVVKVGNSMAANVVGVCSWRGVYAEASIDNAFGADPVTVDMLAFEISLVLAGLLTKTAWNGWGEYTYGRSTRLWADPEGECRGYFPVGLTVDNENGIVRIATSHRDPYNL